MSLAKKEIEHIANLARIGLSNSETEKCQKDLSAVLDWIKQLEEVDVSNIEPISHITGVENVMRDDRSTDFGKEEKIVKLFPEEKDNYDKVKSVL